MSYVAKKLTDLIGNTPMLELNNYKEKRELKASIIAKLEYFNPLGSVKDRIALSMIEQGIKEGTIKKDTILIEPTSGNTGIGLAFVAASKGLKLILTMPDTMSVERRMLVSALGAKVVLSPGSEGMAGAIKKAEQLKEECENAVILQQFENPANPAIHRVTTAEEIWRDMEGKIDFFVAGIGSGGTITGTGETLKEKNPNIKVIAVEPKDSPILSGGTAGAHKIQGIGANFIPKILNQAIIDEVITISNEEAFETSRAAAREEGLLVGISSGAALYAAELLARRQENAGKNIVVLLPDTGERYLSTTLFE